MCVQAKLEASSWFKRRSWSCMACPSRNDMLLFLSKYEAKRVGREAGWKEIPRLYNHALEP